MDKTLTIDGGHFYILLELTNNKVTRAPPITYYMMGWSEKAVKDYANKRKWKVYE